MTVEEMHIAVNLGVQKIASFQVDNLLPEEIDHELNLAMGRFIKQRYNPTSNRLGRGFEQSQKRIDDLRHLVVQAADYTFLPYTDAVFTTNEGQNIMVDRITFPLDYLFLVSVRARVSHNCGKVIAPIYANKTYRFVEINLTPNAPGYFLTGIQRFDGTNWVMVTNTPLGEELTTELLMQASTYNFQLLPYSGTIDMTNMLVSDQGTETSPIADPNKFYLSTNPGNPNDYWIPSGGVYLRTIWINSAGMSSATYLPCTVYKPVGVNTRFYKGGETAIFKAAFYQQDDIYESLNDPFNTTTYREPAYTIAENSIDFYTNNQFVVEYGILNYIRKPKPMSLELGQGCELAEHTHHEIVEMTIKSILEGIQDPRYQSQSIENLESE